MADLMTSLNWVDLFVLILLLRIGYVSSLIGVARQIPALGLLIMILTLTLYAFQGFADGFLGFFAIPPTFARFISYVIIVFVLYMIYRFLLRLLGIKTALELGEMYTGTIERIGGTLVGLLRTFVVTGIWLIGILLLPVNMSKDSVINSYSGLFFVESNLNVYNYIAKSLSRGEDGLHKIDIEDLLSKKDVYRFDVIHKRHLSGDLSGIK